MKICSCIRLFPDHVGGRDTGKITSAGGYGSYGENVRRHRNKAGAVTDIWLAGANLKPEKILAAELERRYAPGKRRPAR